LLDLNRQLLPVDRELAEQQAAELVELLQVGVDERDDLREKCVEPRVDAEVAPELALVLGRRGPVTIDDRREGRVQGLLGQACLEPLALSASGRERMVQVLVGSERAEKFDMTGRIVRFGVILNKEGPLVEIGSRSIFGNSVVGSRQ
jgi:hypothetical protein